MLLKLYRNFACGLRIYVCSWNLEIMLFFYCFFFFIFSTFLASIFFLLQYLGKWYRTNGPLVNLLIFNSSNKNKAGDINSLWNLLVTLNICTDRPEQTVQTKIKCCIMLYLIRFYTFYTPPHNSGRVLWFHVGRPCVCPSIRPFFVSGW